MGAEDFSKALTTATTQFASHIVAYCCILTENLRNPFSLVCKQAGDKELLQNYLQKLCETHIILHFLMKENLFHNCKILF